MSCLFARTSASTDSFVRQRVLVTWNRAVGTLLVVLLIAFAVGAIGVFGPTQKDSGTGPAEIYSGPR